MVSNDDITLSPTRLIKQSFLHTSDIPASSSIIKTLIPPIGRIWEVVSMSLAALALPASTGTHAFQVSNGSAHPVMEGISNSNTTLKWSNNIWEYADYSYTPTTEVGCILALKSVFGDNSNPIEVLYWNGTNTTQANTVTFYFTIKETVY